MKKLFLSIILLGILLNLSAQKRLNAGIGYFGSNATSPGVVLEFEVEKIFTEDLTSPFRTDIGFFSTTDYNTLYIDINKGFRKYFKSGLYVEQSVGIGMSATFFTLESIWYTQKLGPPFRYNDGANWGLMPSLTLGAGYDLSKNKTANHIIWVRPKVFWNLGIRGLNAPYAAIQIGYSYNLKSNK
jgi:hypothetical protein